MGFETVLKSLRRVVPVITITRTKIRIERVITAPVFPNPALIG